MNLRRSTLLAIAASILSLGANAKEPTEKPLMLSCQVFDGLSTAPEDIDFRAILTIDRVNHRYKAKETSAHSTSDNTLDDGSKWHPMKLNGSVLVNKDEDGDFELDLNTGEGNWSSPDWIYTYVCK